MELSALNTSILAHGPFCTLDPQLGYSAAAGVQFGGHLYLSFLF